jgi:preprotein translocase SecE subunit
MSTETEYESNRYVHLLFAAGAICVAYLLSRIGEWVWGFFAKPNDLVLNTAAVAVAIGIAWGAYKNERVFTLGSEVTIELIKVNWPTRAETRAATIVTIVTVLIASSILGLIDVFWSWLTNLVYA